MWDISSEEGTERGWLCRNSIALRQVGQKSTPSHLKEVSSLDFSRFSWNPNPNQEIPLDSVVASFGSCAGYFVNQQGELFPRQRSKTLYKPLFFHLFLTSCSESLPTLWVLQKQLQVEP